MAGPHDRNEPNPDDDSREDVGGPQDAAGGPGVPDPKFKSDSETSSDTGGAADDQKISSGPESESASALNRDKPSDEPTASGEDGQDETKTWVPIESPTQNGSINAAAARTDDPGEQKVGPAATDEAEDVDKTWSPVGTPTHHDFSFEAAAEKEAAVAGPMKTIVASSTPTIVPGNPAALHDAANESGSGDSGAAARSDDTDRTGVAGTAEQPTDPDQPAGHDRSAEEQAGSGTVVIPGRNQSDDVARTAGGTIVMNVKPGKDGTEVYSRTMSMHGLTPEQFDQRQQELAEEEKNASEEAAPLSGDDSSSGGARRTQIWDKQTSAGLDSSLTIRSRPVAGERFDTSAPAEKPDYQIMEKLAEGGMGTIFIANQTSLGREIAIKTLKPLNAGDRHDFDSQERISRVNRQRREMFLSEALVTANLVHPHIIPIHDLCETDDSSPFYVMKRVHGRPWNETIAQMSVEDSLEVLLKVCDAMAYAHHNGVVNRDLKPENIMLGEFGEVLVLDWGLAVPASAADKKRFGSPAAAFGAGTPAYMAPELWTGPAEAIGTWSDVYLLGAILFEIVTGKAPHRFPSPDQNAGSTGLWRAIDSVVRINQIQTTDKRGELLDIAMKAMSSAPRDRHASVLEFQKAIKSYQRHEESRHLSRRASETLAAARGQGHTQSYQNFQTAAALFEEAANAWPDNKTAREGLRTTRLAYAQLAQSKGDYDLGLQVAAQEQGDDFLAIRGRLTAARRLRNGLKYATMVAIGLIVMVGAVSFVQSLRISQQNREITALYGDKQTLLGQKATLELERKELVAEKATLLTEKQNLEQERTTLLTERSDLQQEKSVLLNDRNRLQSEKDALVIQKADLTAQKDSLFAQKTALEKDKRTLESDKQGLVAEIAKVEDEKAEIAKDVQALVTQKVRLTEEKIRADVELRNASIASLIRDADYAAALQKINELLNALHQDPQLAELPERERRERTVELKARQQQLLRRTRAADSPVQTQVISPSGKTVVWGDRQGQLRLWRVNDAANILTQDPTAELALGKPVSMLCLSADEQLVVAAAGDQVHLWRPGQNQHRVITGDGHRVTAVQLDDSFVLTADQRGDIRAWNLTQLTPLWSIRTGAAIRDLALLAESGIFLYAASRGGESADVLAYRLPEEAAKQDRPVRLGQLRFPRDRIFPPLRMAVSPDEQLLLISNTRNGDLLALPRRPTTDERQGDRFPFVHASDLARTDHTDWVLSGHQRPVNDIEFSSDGGRMVSASDDRTIGVWRVTKGSDATAFALIHRLEGHGARVNAAAFLDSDGKHVLSASADRYCRVWDVEQYEQQRRAIEAEFDLAEPELTETRSPLRRYVLTGLSDSAAVSADDDSVNNAEPPEYRIINADGRRQRGALSSVVLTPEGTRLVTGASDGTAVIWDTQTGDPVTGVSPRRSFLPGTSAFEEGHDFNVARLRFLPPGGDVLLTTGFDGSLCLWNADLSRPGAGNQELRIPGLGLVNAFATSADGDLIATSTESGNRQAHGAASIWRTEDLLRLSNPEPMTVLDGFHRLPVSALAISPDGRHIATGAGDGRLAVWTTDGGTLLAGGQIHARNTVVSHLEWLHNDAVLSAGFDGRLRIVVPPSAIADTEQPDADSDSDSESTPSLTVIQSFQHDRIPIERVAVATNGQEFVTISVRTDRAGDSVKSELQLWQVSSERPVRQIDPAIVRESLPKRIAAISWSPDDTRLAAVVDGHLQLFDTESWRVIKVLEAPGLGISDAVFAPSPAEPSPAAPNDGVDPRHLLATFNGTAAHLWNLNNYSHVADFRPLFAVQAVAISGGPAPLLLTGDRAIRVFQADDRAPDFGQTLSKISDPHRGIITSLQFAPYVAGREPMFVSTGADGSAIVWKYARPENTPAQVQSLRTQGPRLVATAWSEDGRSILLAAVNGEVTVNRFGEADSSVVRLSTGAETDVRLAAAAIREDGRYIAVAGQLTESRESVAWVYEVTTDGKAKLHAVISGHEAGGINGICFLPESPYVVTGGADGDVIIWNWQPDRVDEMPLNAYEAYQFLVADGPGAHEAAVSSISVSKTGRIATGSEDGTAIIWQNPFSGFSP
ncbi:MAG: protein kinase [Fuerstiella sp.]